VGCIHSAFGEALQSRHAILGLDEFFTNSPGQYVKLQATISGLTGLVDGMYDQLPHRWNSLVEFGAFSKVGQVDT
jgi:F0F1-type ATP synthase beta subunit